MKGIEIRDFCGDYAIDIPMGDRSVCTIYFNSYRNAETVKRIIEVDESVPNAATVCDMVEVVRCKDCVYNNGACTHSEIYDDTNYNPDYYCADGERKEQT